ncbi:MAG: hypothetical protein KF760_19520 [Candidatus Eremiobacteraeota bacterium]|nr:hypothetical protein [Candidatus Eremiobacteraeota bacterium]MCW5868761.1 hypothetical protein [Candidatus Eremiobacteraeota bacterium]
MSEKEAVILEIDASPAIQASQPDSINLALVMLDSIMVGLSEANQLNRERERLVDRLHEENRRLRAGELQQAISPICRDLIRLYDELEKSSQVALEFKYFRDLVSDILNRHAALETFGPGLEGTLFEPREQRAVATTCTADPARDRTLARVIRVGFRAGERIFRPLEAEVYRFQPASII